MPFRLQDRLMSWHEEVRGCLEAFHVLALHKFAEMKGDPLDIPRLEVFPAHHVVNVTVRREVPHPGPRKRIFQGILLCGLPLHFQQDEYLG